LCISESVAEINVFTSLQPCCTHPTSRVKYGRGCDYWLMLGGRLAKISEMGQIRTMNDVAFQFISSMTDFLINAVTGCSVWFVSMITGNTSSDIRVTYGWILRWRGNPRLFAKKLAILRRLACDILSALAPKQYKQSVEWKFREECLYSFYQFFFISLMFFFCVP